MLSKYKSPRQRQKTAITLHWTITVVHEKPPLFSKRGHARCCDSHLLATALITSGTIRAAWSRDMFPRETVIDSEPWTLIQLGRGGRIEWRENNEAGWNQLSLLHCSIWKYRVNSWDAWPLVMLYCLYNGLLPHSPFQGQKNQCRMDECVYCLAVFTLIRDGVMCLGH